MCDSASIWFFCLTACAASTLPSNPTWLLSVKMWTRASLMRKTPAATVLIVQNIVVFIVGLHCATSVQCLKRTRTLPDGRQETGAYAGGGCTGCMCTPPPGKKSSAQKCPKEERKFRLYMSAKKNVHVRLRYDKIKTKKLGKKKI